MVEDDRDTAQLLCSLLAVAGFEARSIARPDAAVRVILEERVDVTVVSLSRGGIDMVTSLVASIRQRPEPPLRDAGVVALVDDEYDLFFGLGIEAHASLVRPIAPGELIDRVTEVAATIRRPAPVEPQMSL